MLSSLTFSLFVRWFCVFSIWINGFELWICTHLLISSLISKQSSIRKTTACWTPNTEHVSKYYKTTEDAILSLCPSVVGSFFFSSFNSTYPLPICGIVYICLMDSKKNFNRISDYQFTGNQWLQQNNRGNQMMKIYKWMLLSLLLRSFLLSSIKFNTIVNH